MVISKRRPAMPLREDIVLNRIVRVMSKVKADMSKMNVEMEERKNERR